MVRDRGHDAISRGMSQKRKTLNGNELDDAYEVPRRVPDPVYNAESAGAQEAFLFEILDSGTNTCVRNELLIPSGLTLLQQRTADTLEVGRRNPVQVSDLHGELRE